MNRIAVIAASLLIITGGLGYISHIVTSQQAGQQDTATIKTTHQLSTNDNWKSALQKVDIYYKAKQTVTNPDETVTKKQVKLTDGKLVGIVVGAQPLVYVLIPEKSEPAKLLPGDSWLSPWSLKHIGADSVIWENLETQDTVTQYLFQ